MYGGSDLSLSFNVAVFTDCTATSGTGSAVFTTGSEALSLTEVSVSGTVATSDGPDGGAVVADASSVSVSESELTGNTLTGGTACGGGLLACDLHRVWAWE